MKIRPEETELRGRWVMRDRRPEADETCARIEALVRDHLRKLGADPTGWDVLYVDEADGRYWELTYPDSDRHGGGAPLLTALSPADASGKYGKVVGR